MKRDVITGPSSEQSAWWDHLANLPFPGDYPTDDSADTLWNELTFQRAVQTYLWALPAMNLYAMREGQKTLCGVESNVLAIWKDRLDYQTVVTTPNPDVIYAFAWLDLKKEGPTLLDMPPGLQGLLDDSWHRPLTDIGTAGPDEGEGGRYLVLPPDFEDEITVGGYDYEIRSPTYGVFVFLRAFLDDGSTATGVQLLEQSKIYPLAKYHEQPTMEFPNLSGIPMNGICPKDSEYFQWLADFIDYEAVDREDFAMRGMLAGLGIVKGEPFSPSGEMTALLDKAARVGHNMSAATYDFRPPSPVYSDRNWEPGFIGGSPVFEADTYRYHDASNYFFHKGYSTSDGMCNPEVDTGSQYLLGFRDQADDYLIGENTYRVVFPEDVPVLNYWSVVLYDADTRSLLDNQQVGQPFPSIASNTNLVLKPGGSAEIYFGPQQPAGSENWIQTVSEKGYFVLIRLYSPTQAYFDQDWRPGDIEKLLP